MIESGLTTSDINNREANISNYYPSGQSDWNTEKAEALKELIQDVQDMGYNLRQVCKRHSLTSSTASEYTATTATEAATGTKSAEDEINRRRLTVKASSITGSGTVVFTLQGTDDSSSETWTDITTLNVTSTTATTTVFNNIYKYYRLNVTSFDTITSITYTAYLIETTFEILHLYKTLEIIYRELIRIEGENIWGEKMQDYKDEYNDRLSKTHIYYDEDDGGTISEDETEDDMRDVTFYRGGVG